MLARTLGFAIAATLTAVGLLVRCASPVRERASSAAPRAEGTSAGSGPTVLVELFTSEGCSSCPSAETVTASLARGGTGSGVRLVLLAHHVDYWDHLGWRDPFSSAEATARQHDYASLGGGGLYTPQAVIDGQFEVVGSRRAAIETAVANAARAPHAAVIVDTRRRDDDPAAFDVSVRAELPRGRAPVELLVAVVQDQARVAVPRGENAGRTLDHAAVARALYRLGASERVAKTTVRIPPPLFATDGGGFSLIAVAQDPSSRAVVGTAAVPLAR